MPFFRGRPRFLGELLMIFDAPVLVIEVGVSRPSPVDGINCSNPPTGASLAYCCAGIAGVGEEGEGLGEGGEGGEDCGSGVSFASAILSIMPLHWR